MNTRAADAITIRVLDTVPSAEWNDYVHSHAAGSVFHVREWAAVYAELAWIDPCYLEARRAGALVGIMPLAIVRWWPRGCALVSAPYCVEAGALADDSTVQAALEDAAAEHAHKCCAHFLEVRQTMGQHAAWPVHSQFAGFARALAPTRAANLAAIPRKQRAMIRKGEAAGLVAREGMSMTEFYALYARSVRDLGTPVYAAQLFDAIARQLAPYVNIICVTQADTAVAAVMSFYFRDCVMPYYAGAQAQARTLKAYDFMYWELMSAALERGCTRFDFGRSVHGSGAFAFKKNWGFEPRSLCYQLLPIGHTHAPKLDPDSPFNVIARRAWARLPLALTNTFGPLLARRLF